MTDEPYAARCRDVMKFAAVLAIGWACVQPVAAQSVSAANQMSSAQRWEGLGCIDCPEAAINAEQSHAATGNPDLDRAMGICDAHQTIGAMWPEGGRPTTYEQGWGACVKVIGEWQNSAQAKAQREAADRERRDKAFVDGYAKHLGESQ